MHRLCAELRHKRKSVTDKQRRMHRGAQTVSMKHGQRDKRILAASTFLTVQLADCGCDVVHCAVGQSNYFCLSAGSAAVHVTHDVIVRTDNGSRRFVVHRIGVSKCGRQALAFQTGVQSKKRLGHALVVCDGTSQKRRRNVGEFAFVIHQRIEKHQRFATRLAHNVGKRGKTHARMYKASHKPQLGTSVKRRNTLRTGRQIQRYDIALR